MRHPRDKTNPIDQAESKAYSVEEAPTAEGKRNAQREPGLSEPGRGPVDRVGQTLRAHDDTGIAARAFEAYRSRILSEDDKLLETGEREWLAMSDSRIEKLEQVLDANKPPEP